MNKKRRIITNPQKIGFRILSSTFKLIKSIIKKTIAPLRAIIIAFINGRKGSNIHNTKITVTILPLLLPNLQTLLQQKITGILNYVNDGITSPSELLNICNVNHVISSEKTNRGLCCLDVSLLKKYTPVENFAELDKIKM